MTDFRGIKSAAVEGKYDDESLEPGFTPRPRQSPAEQIRAMQNAARASAHVNATLAGRYLLVGGVLALIGICWYGPPAWLRDTEFWIGILLASRGLWCWEISATKRRETALDPTEFLGGPD